MIGNWQLSGLAAGPADFLQRNQRRGLGNQLAGEEQHGADRRDFDGNVLHSNGAPEVFSQRGSSVAELQNPYPGEAGHRNNFRGDGYFGIDMRLAKTWKLTERPQVRLGRLQRHQLGALRREPAQFSENLTTSGSFGVYGATLTKPRVQQISLRFWF